MTRNLVIFGIINLLTCILSGASGAGGAILSTPLMVLLGLTPPQAIATAKFAGFGVSLGSSLRFYKEKLTDKRTVIIFSLIGGVAAALGSITLVHFQNETEIIQKLMGVVILAVAIPMLYFREAGLTTRQPPTWLKLIGLLLLGVGVFIQVAIGTGIGSLQMVVLITCFGMNALVASATRRAMQLLVSIVSLAIFIVSGLVDYKFGLVGLVTALVGGYIGAHLAVQKGNKFVINLFAAVSALLAIQLLFS